MSEAKYELVDVEMIEEGGQQYSNIASAPSTSNPSGYPGFLRKGASPVSDPPTGTVFVKTGGNALQAIDTSVLEQESVVRVIVPEGKLPGESILVQCPHIHGRYVPTTIPDDAKEGTEFLVRVPPLNEDPNFSTPDMALTGANLLSKVTAKQAMIAAGVVTGMMLL